MGICALPMHSTDVYTYPYMHMPDLVRHYTAAENMMLDFVISTFVCFHAYHPGVSSLNI